MESSSAPQEYPPCPLCGGPTAPAALGPGPGRTIAWRNLQRMEIPRDLVLPTCPECLAVALDPIVIASIQPRLEDAYLFHLRCRFRWAHDVLVPRHITQRNLGQLIGASAGYLSRLYTTRKARPSSLIVGLLLSLASDPDPSAALDRLRSAYERF